MFENAHDHQHLPVSVAGSRLDWTDGDPRSVDTIGPFEGALSTVIADFSKRAPIAWP